LNQKTWRKRVKFHAASRACRIEAPSCVDKIEGAPEGRADGTQDRKRGSEAETQESLSQIEQLTMPL
jgi:hypothetical protein